MPKLCVLAATRMRHEWLRIPRASLTVHAGHFIRTGTLDESIAFLEWLGALPGMKVLVAGPQDVAAHEHRHDFEDACARNGVVFLAGERATVAGLRVWGGTSAPPEGRMELDLLVTHEAPYGIGDRAALRSSNGSLPLLRRVHELEPRVHVFCGTSHQAGLHRREGSATAFLNGSFAIVRYLFGGPLVHDLPSPLPVWNDETVMWRGRA